MIDFRPVIHIMGWISAMIGGLLALPTVLDLSVGNPDWRPFLASSLLSFFIGVLLVLSTRQRKPLSLDLRQAFLVTIFGWFTVSILGALPMLGVQIGFVDAVFESVSGITTTGSTILTGLDALPPGLLLWRALLQWIGGIGIIAMATLILPMLRVGGMQLFKIESSDTSSEKVTNAITTMWMLMLLYLGLTVLCGVLYYALGMNGFDAATHAMATLSTGGFSTHDASFGYFDDLALEWVATVFMFLGSLPFLLYIRAIQGKPRTLFHDSQVRVFFLTLTLIILAVSVWQAETRAISIQEAFADTAFNITSVVTTTGFATEDYTQWGFGASGLFLVLMFMGGCTGSTSGSIKIYRYQILHIIVRAHVKRLISPHRVVPLSYNGKSVSEEVSFSVLAFFAVFIATIAVVTIGLSFMGLDIVTAYSAAVTAITNVGPGLGNVIGPAGNFASLTDPAKVLLTITMLAGRLEVLALLVAFDRDFWRY
ncbi:TrkH family potassium uptake protein [Hwanghaeella grinnelliae]|uniref:Trk system potassium uptake protein n=1 Tax=Hwanghaeella grinnelliae TaxID=2500179 RepID=A0A3S2W9S7_9PROT|nr:TrkH family potassium uptake protein [Hwanghaeella grinnelliae]RVU36722.1 TrkH family potassium uptake protein [Hwanghaeella grinnelliae]